MTRLILDSDKLRMRICGGIHCSAGGGGQVLEEAFQSALEAYGVADKVEIFRAHCLGECAEGPCVRIGTERYYHVEKADADRIIREAVLPKL